MLRRCLIALTLPALTACYSPVSEDIASLGSDFETGSAAADVHVTGEDLNCTQDLPKIGRMHVTNFLGLTEQAEAVARSPTGGSYPVGTMLVANPYEVMVKRGPGFSEATGDWEFLFVEPTEEGTVILDRGTTEVVGLAPGTPCIECHSQAEPEWDFVCADGHGCADNPLFGPLFELFIDSDPRCGHRLAADL
jgi:hypothetical protein